MQQLKYNENKATLRQLHVQNLLICQDSSSDFNTGILKIFLITWLAEKSCAAID